LFHCRDGSDMSQSGLPIQGSGMGTPPQQGTPPGLENLNHSGHRSSIGTEGMEPKPIIDNLQHVHHQQAIHPSHHDQMLHHNPHSQTPPHASHPGMTPHHGASSIMPPHSMIMSTLHSPESMSQHHVPGQYTVANTAAAGQMATLQHHDLHYQQSLAHIPHHMASVSAHAPVTMHEPMMHGMPSSNPVDMST